MIVLGYASPTPLLTKNLQFKRIERWLWPKKIFFICRHNSGSSQIAKACLGSLYDDAFEIESEGLEQAESVNSIVVQVMAEAGIDLSEKKTSKRVRFVWTRQTFRMGRCFKSLVISSLSSD